MGFNSLLLPVTPAAGAGVAGKPLRDATARGTVSAGGRGDRKHRYAEAAAPAQRCGGGLP